MGGQCTLTDHTRFATDHWVLHWTGTGAPNSGSRMIEAWIRDTAWCGAWSPECMAWEMGSRRLDEQNEARGMPSARLHISRRIRSSTQWPVAVLVTVADVALVSTTHETTTTWCPRWCRCTMRLTYLSCCSVQLAASGPDRSFTGFMCHVSTCTMVGLCTAKE